LKQGQLSSVNTKAARNIITSPGTLNLSNGLTQSNVDNPRLEPLSIETPQSALSSRINVPIIKSNSIETLHTTDNHSSSSAAVLQSTPSSSTKKENKRVEESGPKTNKRCINWSEKETTTFITVWSEYYLRLNIGETRHAPIYDQMAKQHNEMSLNRCFTDYDVKRKIGNLAGEYRRKKKNRDDLDNIIVPDCNLTQATEQANEFTSIVNTDGLIPGEFEHSFTTSSPSKSSSISKTEMPPKKQL
ncbi:unnamed protein product, partial [Rotaria sp. Silwood2]